MKSRTPEKITHETIVAHQRKLSLMEWLRIEMDRRTAAITPKLTTQQIETLAEQTRQYIARAETMPDEFFAACKDGNALLRALK
jgi:hypothetical protein